MTVRWPLAACAGALVALALAQCGCEREPARAPADTPERARVLAFWKSFHEATARRTAGDCAAAVEFYDQALDVDPRHEDSLYYLGQCLRELHRPAQARRALERLAETNPHSARAHMGLGALLASPDPSEPLDLAAAERCFRRAHEINAEETGPIVRLAEVLIVSGRHDEARQLLEAAARTNPKSVEAALLAGYVAWRRGDAARARTFAARALQACHAEAPIRGVLSEGDRKPAGEAARHALPLAHPMGRMMFSAVVPGVCAEGASGAGHERAWRDIQRVESDHARRASGPAPG